MFEFVRSRAYGVIASPLGDAIVPVRWAKAAARYCNDVVGRPLATDDEFKERREFAAQQAGQREQAEAAAVAQAPVLVFHDSRRESLRKIRQILDGDSITYELRDIENDPAAIAAASRDSGGQPLPVVFIAGECVGGPAQLTTLVGAGKLKKLAFPEF